MSQARLSRATLKALQHSSEGVPELLVDPAELSIGIVHFGIGAFHRAHQAVFTEDAVARTGDARWGILGVTGRTDGVVLQLRPQDCLYGVLERGADVEELRLVGVVRDVAWPGADAERIVETLAAPTTHIATLTITEKGYLRASNGDVNLGNDAVRADVVAIAAELSGQTAGSGRSPSGTPLGLLVRGLARRFNRGSEPLTVVSCDNVVDNGSMTRRLVVSYGRAIVEAAEDAVRAAEFAAWLGASVAFPSTMVDRLTPATTGEDHELAESLLGLHDAALVVTEPFRQWVIEDHFAGPRPAWELAGAILTQDVGPYEQAKLRILNGAHSMLAYLGALAGYETIAEAVADEPIRSAVIQVLDADILPTVAAPPGIDVADYRDSVLNRFANPQLKHTTRQVAMDGSQKVPLRWLGPAEEQLAAGRPPHGVALAVAAWIAYVAASVREGDRGSDSPESTVEVAASSLDDPMAAQLTAAVSAPDASGSDPDALVRRFLAIDGIFPEHLRDSSAFRRAIVEAFPTVDRLTAPRIGLSPGPLPAEVL